MSRSGLLDREGEGRVVTGVPGADEFGAIVGLNPGLDAFEVDPASLDIFENCFSKNRGMGKKAFLGIAEKLQARDDLPCGVLDLWKSEMLDFGPEFRNIVEILGVGTGLLKEPPLSFGLS